MSINEDKAFETDSGIILGGAGVFSGSASPLGSQAPQWSVYYRTNGEIYSKTGTGVNDWTLIGFGGSSLENKTFDFADEAGNGLVGNKDAYKMQGMFIFEGTNKVGSIAKIRYIASATASTTGWLKIYDATNALTISEYSFVGDGNFALREITAISNLPANQAIFELQLKYDGGNQDTVHCLYMDWRMV